MATDKKSLFQAFCFWHGLLAAIMTAKSIPSLAFQLYVAIQNFFLLDHLTIPKTLMVIGYTQPDL
jgi:hypothetical protein